jgi:hypothetical protein
LGQGLDRLTRLDGHLLQPPSVLRRTRSKVWRLQGIYAISSKFGKVPVNIRVVVAREAYKETGLQGPSAVVALPAAGIGKDRVLQGHHAIVSILLTGSFVVQL